MPAIRIRQRRQTRALSLSAPGGAPSEFRIFTAGTVETSKGTFLFDEAAAAAVLEAHRQQGNELMVDYDHASVSMSLADPALAGRAAGWFDLEVRGGELWAVNVRWTPPAAEALANREWRYMSPAFNVDDSGRIVELINVALTNLPATQNLTPLVAASLNGAEMSPEQFAAIAEALGLGADANIEDVLATIGAMMKKVQDAMAGGEEPPAEEPAADPMMESEAAAPADPEMQAASIKLCSLTGRASIGEALADVELWRASYLDLAAERAKIAKSQSTLEANERRSLVAQLVALGAETPATAFVDASVKSPRLRDRLALEPIADLRNRVATLSAGRPAPVVVRPPTSPVNSNELSARELAMCAAKKIDPAKYAATRAAIAARSNAPGAQGNS